MANSFAHIPAAVLSAINAVGIAESSLERAYTIVSQAYHADKLSAPDGKLCIAMSLVHHMPSKYSKDYVRKGDDAGVVRDSALERKVARDWNTRVVGIVALDTATVRVARAEREAYETMVAELAKARAKYVKSIGDAKRAALVKLTLGQRK